MKWVISFILLLLAVGVHGQVWQWSTSVEDIISGETNDHPVAFLWIPENCQQVKAVVIGQHNMLEEGILEHQLFRENLTELGLAEIWITPAPDMVFRFDKDAGTWFTNMMNKLAEASGYKELSIVPVIPIGHSAAASFPWNFAAWNPGRTLAAISIHGDAPLSNLTGSGQPNPDWGNRTLNGVPGLMVMGEYEWLPERLKPALAYIQAHPNAPISMLADAGRGHFDYSDELVTYLSLFIKKSVKARLPSNTLPGQPIVLKPVQPTKGWLADRWHTDSLPAATAAPYNMYRGDRSQAFWYFDKEIALATEKYYAAVRGKLLQYIGFMQQGTLLPFNTRLHARINGKFTPLEDGLSFHIQAVYTDTLRTRQSVQHAATNIHISRICGPVIKLDDSTFSVRFYRIGLNNAKRSGDIWLMATSEGDEQYKHSVQQLNLHIPLVNAQGQPQAIDFPAINDITAAVKQVQLKASTSAGLPVYYYVKEGPAEWRNGRLKITPVPPRAKYPVKVTVVAWQYGRTSAPLIQSAVPVTQSFYIHR